MISLAHMMDMLNFSANLSGLFHSPKYDSTNINFFPSTCIIIIGILGIFYGIFQTWRRQRNRKHHQFVAKLKSIAENAQKKAKDERGKKKREKSKTSTKKKEIAKKRTKKTNHKIQLQPEIWTDIVQWISFQELAKSLSLVNGQLQEICAPKIYEENRRVVNPIGIEKKGENDSESDSDESDSVYDNWDSDEEEDGGEGKKKCKEGEKKKKDGKKEEEILRVQKCVWDSEYSELVEIPLATVPPPPNIIGFRRINIRHLNDQILAFLRLIKPLIESGPNEVCLSIDDRRRCSRTERNRGFRFQQLLDLFKILQGPVANFSVMEERLRDPFWKHMRSFILSLQFLTFDGNYFYGTSMPILIRWLNTTRADGKSRYYFVRWNDGEHCIRLIERLREAFTNAQSSSTFIVEFDVTDLNAEDMQPPEPFLLRNELNERLALGRYRYGTENNLILRRFPALPTAIGDDWMKPVLEKARKLMCGPMNKARDLGMDENGDLEEAPLNEIKLALEWPYSPFS